MAHPDQSAEPGARGALEAQAAAGASAAVTPEERLDIIQRVARVGFWQMRASDRRVAVSAELRALYGIDAAAPEPDFDTLLMRVHPDDRAQVDARLAAAVRGSRVFDMEYRVLAHDGATRYVHSRGELVTLGDGVPTYYGSVHDISGQRQAQQASARLAERLCATLESITDIFFTLERDWRFTYLNREAQRHFGGARRELLGQSLWQQRGGLALQPQHDQLRRAMRERCAVAFDAFHPASNQHFAVRAYAFDDGLSVYLRDVSAQKQAEDALRRSEERFRIVARVTSDAIWDLDVARDTLWFSSQLRELLGYAPADFETSLALWMERIHPDDRQRVVDEFHRTVHASSELNWTDDYRFLRKDDTVAHVHDRAHILRAADGRPTRVIGAVVDVSRQRQADARIREQASLLDQARDAIVVIGLERQIRYWNHGAERLFGWPAADAGNLATADLLYAGGAMPAEALRSVLASGEWRGEVLGRRQDGGTLTLEARWTLVRDEHGAAQAILTISTDISARKQAEHHLHYMAFHDALTHLPNRHLLLERLEAVLEAGRASGGYSALLLVDLDNFKTLNDTLGHSVGDRLLQQMALRLYAGLAHDTTVARFGGDEFAILLGDLAPDKHAASTHARREGERIIGLLGQPFALDGYRVQPGASIGVTVFSGDAVDAGELVQRADMAMYRAKAAGRGTVRFFDPSLQAAAMARLALENDLRDAVRSGAFFLHYQPQVERSGRIAGVEALVRWRHPTRGVISPAEFIPLAEENGMALPLGQWVLEHACLQLSSWALQAETAHLEIAVNVSARQLHHPAFVAQVLACLGPSGADPRKLKLEITEGTLLEDVEDAIGKISALRAHGLSFAIDDFGTGYSSLAYLKRLPLDMLKIDRSFVLDLTTNPNDAVIARTIIALGASLGLKVLAEGVETEAQRDFLFENGCQAYQGFLCARPLAAEELGPMLRRMQPAH